MAGGVMARMGLSHRILRWDSTESDEFSGHDPAALNISDTVFGFLDEESEGSLGSNSSHNGHVGGGGGGESNEQEEEEEEDEEEEVGKENPGNSQKDESFWENQNQLLHGTLCRTSSIESRIRSITKEAIKEARKREGSFCVCGKEIGNSCRSCLMEDVCRSLQNAGFNSAICKSKWKSSPDIPSGEHSFIDVLENSKGKRGGEMRVIIELGFRGEFEMARASDEYKQLINRLPEVFVGKVERLMSLIKILCTAAKKCMKIKKIHMGPWRKQRYMQAKWLKTCERINAAPPLITATATTGYSTRTASRPRASMLTVDLLDINNMPGFNLTAVEVI